MWTRHCIRALDVRFALGSATFMFQVMELAAGVLGMNDLTTPGVEPGLSRPRRDVLTTDNVVPGGMGETLQVKH